MTEISLEARTEPYREELVHNARRAHAVALWLRAHPQCHAEVRAGKLMALRELEREAARLDAAWEAELERWRAERIALAEREP